MGIVQLQQKTLHPENTLNTLLPYQTPIIKELEINELTSSATNINHESNSGYYS